MEKISYMNEMKQTWNEICNMNYEILNMIFEMNEMNEWNEWMNAMNEWM